MHIFVNHLRNAVNAQCAVSGLGKTRRKVMRAEAVLFDKDGTLFDFQKTWSGWVAGLIRARAGDDASVAAGLSKTLGFDLAAQKFLPESIAIAGTALQSAKQVLHYYPGMTAQELAANLTKQLKLLCRLK